MRLIDADYLLDVLRVHEDEWDTPDETWRPESDYAGAIKAAPTIEAEPVRRGHWLYTEAWPHRVYCSVCYRTYALKHWKVWEDGSLARAYCPHCGAKMEGDE